MENTSPAPAPVLVCIPTAQLTENSESLPNVHGEVQPFICACPKGAACERPGKHPRVAGYTSLPPGLNGTASDTNKGIKTGRASNVFVLDCDSQEAVAFVEATFAPDTYAVDTGRGRHYYFTYEPITISKFPGRSDIDLRCDVPSDYVMAEGSRHEHGHVYKGNGKPVAKAPPALAIVLLSDSRKPKPVTDYDPVDLSTEEGQRLECEAIRYARDQRVIRSEEGGGKQTFAVAQKLLKLFRMPTNRAFEIMREHIKFEPDWTDSELWHKIEDSVEQGQYDPSSDRADLDAARGASKKARERAEAKGLSVLDGGLIKEPGATAEPKAPRSPEADVSHLSAIGSNEENDPFFVRLEDPLNDPTKADTKVAKYPEVLQILLTHPSWEGVLGFDFFKCEICYLRKPPIALRSYREGKSFSLDEDTLQVTVWFAHNKMSVDANVMRPALISAAKERGFHSAKDYFNSLPEEDPSFLDEACKILFGVDDNLSRRFFRHPMIASVARTLLDVPYKYDTVTILQGRQGARKSSFLQALYGELGAIENSYDLQKTDALFQLNQGLALELAEMQGTREANVVKNFASRTYDTYRKPYGASVEKHLRRNVCWGTTNEGVVNYDPTGGRRFEVIEIPNTHTLPVEWVKENRDRLWAAAKTAYLQGVPPYLDTPELVAEAKLRIQNYTEASSYENDLLAALANEPGPLTPKEVWTKIGQPEENFHREATSLGRAMRAIGWEIKLTRSAPGPGGRVRKYFRIE